MKFVCDSCRAQYMISDEKVGPAGVKVRCKKCGHIIVVKRVEAASAGTEPGPGESTEVMQNPMSSHASAGPSPGANGSAQPGFGGAGLEDEIGAAFDTMFSKKDSANGAAAPGGDHDEETQAEDSSGGEDFDKQSTRVFSLREVEKLARESGQEFDLGAQVAARRAELDSSLSPPPAPPAEDPSAHEWYVAINDEQVGPLPFDDVKSKWDGSEIGPDTLCWRAGLPDWKPLSQVQDLAGKLAPKKAVARPAPAAEAPAAMAAAPGTGGATGGREVLPWERAGAGGEAAAAAGSEENPDEVDWKPSAASALASLVEQEMAAAKGSEPAAPRAAAGPARSEPVPSPETSGIRSLLSDLPEPPAPEPSRIIPVPAGEKLGLDLPDSRPRVELRSSASISRPHDEKGGIPKAVWYIVGGSVGLLVVVGGVFGILAAAGVFNDGPSDSEKLAALEKKLEEQKAAADSEAGKPGADDKKDDEKKAAAEDKGKEEPKKAEGEKGDSATASAVEEKDRGKDDPKKDAPAEKTKVARVGGTGGAARSTPSPRTETRAPDPVPEPPKSSGGGKGGSIDDLFNHEFNEPTGGKTPAVDKGKEKPKDEIYIPPPPGQKTKPAKLQQSQIMEVVRGHLSSIKTCADKYKATGAGKGTVVMIWTIQANGRTTGIRPKSGEHGPLASCLGGLIKGWKFPEAQQSSPIEFPFGF